MIGVNTVYFVLAESGIRADEETSFSCKRAPKSEGPCRYRFKAKGGASDCERGRFSKDAKRVQPGERKVCYPKNTVAENRYISANNTIFANEWSFRLAVLALEEMARRNRILTGA